MSGKAIAVRITLGVLLGWPAVVLIGWAVIELLPDPIGTWILVGWAILAFFGFFAGVAMIAPDEEYR